MNFVRMVPLFGVLLSGGGSPVCCVAQVVLETDDLRLEIDEAGVARSLVAKSSGEEYNWVNKPAAAFSVVRAKEEFDASSVTRRGDRLRVEFGNAGTTATLRVVRLPTYLVLRLELLEGKPVDQLNLLRLRVRRLPSLGTWINVAYDDTFGICLCGGTKETNATMLTRVEEYVELTASAHREPGFDGATAVLMGCPKPKKAFLQRMAVVERDLGLPEGANHRMAPAYKYSYLWVTPTPDDIDECIRWAKRGGFRMILFSYTAFTTSCGHFGWNDRYPNGMADLKKVTDAIRQAGLAVGLHIHYSKAHKSDAYVTPVPDDRLHKVRTFALASDVDAGAHVVPVRESPDGCTMDDQRRILKVGEELIAYTSYTTDPPYRFEGCERGHLKTTAATHAAGGEAALLDVDTWPIFIRFDQNTDIQDETAERLGAIYRETGPYDMVYFDGAEDVHTPRWYHTANAQWRVFRHFDPPPTICEAAANSHFGWHMISRSNAYDSVAPEEMKDFCRKAPCRTAPRRELDFTQIDFGWLHGFGRSASSYISPDILEFILSRGAAWDCPFSMTVNAQQLDTNPRTEDCFDLIKLWEDARIEGKLTDQQREQLKDLDQEHHLFLNEKGDLELVAIDEVPEVAGGRSFKAYSFQRDSRPNDTHVLIWAVSDEADLTLPVPEGRFGAMRPFGNALDVSMQNGKATLPIGGRTYLVFRNMDVRETSVILAKATSSLGPPVAVYLPAKSLSNKVGELSLTGEVGTQVKGAFGDCLVPTAPHSHLAPKDWYAEYTFDLPAKGRWHLWGRMKYKDTNSNSFFVGLPKTPEKRERFGNSYVWGEWLWESGGSYWFDKGPATVRVYVRESAPKQSPALDVLCLTNEAGYVPTDELAKDALAE